MKIVVLGGGISTERHVSLVTSISVCRALRSMGHKAIFVDLYFGLEDYGGDLNEIFDSDDDLCGDACIEIDAPDIESIKNSRKTKSSSRIGNRVLDVCAMADCVFLGFHGADGEDGKIQAVLDLMGVPFTGSGYLGSAMAMNKAVAKKIMEYEGILTPSWSEIEYADDQIGQLSETLPIPCVVKVPGGGSSIGVFVCDSKDELRNALEKALKFGNHVIIEEKIIGRERTVPVLDNKYLSPIEIIPPEGSVFDYAAKYQSGSRGAREICPAEITPEEKKKMGEAALRLHRALGLSVYSRTDFMLDDSGNPWCLEINTLPGMTPNSLIPKSAAVEGMSYPELCEKIIQLSVAKKN